ncbi:MAG: ATP-binding protein [Crocosphaera sp.]|nr:ATP-binding protein [Crocosphaera sp.]
MLYIPPIYGVVGEQGTGKSFTALKTILPFANIAEYDLCFNYEINLRALYDYCIIQRYNWLACRILHNKVRVKDSEDLEEFMDLPKTIYVLDEAGVYLNSRAFQSVPKTFLAQLAQVRHDQKILVWCAQYADMVDRVLRELTAMYCQCLSVSKFSKKLGNYEMYWQKIYIYNARKYKIYLSKVDQKLSGLKFWINSRKLADWHYEGLLSQEDKMIFDIYNSFGSHIGYQDEDDVHNYFDLEVFSSIKSSLWVNSPLSEEEKREINGRIESIFTELGVA